MQKANKFLTGGDGDWDSDDSDAWGAGAKREVRSGRDKVLSTLDDLKEGASDAMDEADWISAGEKLDPLLTNCDKYVTMTTGPTRAGIVPNVFVRAMVELVDTAEAAFNDKEGLKALNKLHAKALTTLRQRLKKVVDGSPELRDKMDACRKDPTEFLDEEEEVAGDVSTAPEEQERDSIFKMDANDITFAVVNEKLSDLRIQRGRKGQSRQEQLNLLLFLRRHAKGDAQEVAIVLQLISLMLDMTPASAQFLPATLWRRAVMYLTQVLDVVVESKMVSVSDAKETVAFEERAEEEPTSGPVVVPGNLVGLVDRLDEELFKSLQMTDPHTNEYLVRLKDEAVLLAVAQRVAEYLTSRSDTPWLACVALRQLEHYYFKTAAVFEALKKAAVQPMAINMRDAESRISFAMENADAVVEDADADVKAVGKEGADDGKVVLELQLVIDQSTTLTSVNRDLAALVFSYGDERMKARALLCLVFHHSLMGQYHRARDMLLMSHLQDSVSSMDIHTQILYNRAMASLGICAFKNGLIQESYACMA